MDEFIPQYNYVVVKLDLRNYKNLSQHLSKPYDLNLVKVLQLVGSSLMTRFNPDTIYIGYYQIVLFFSSKCSINEFEQLYKNPNKKIESHIYNGSTNMILSLISSYCSVKFNHYLEKIFNQEKINHNYSKELEDLIYKNEQIFTGTINYSHESHEIIQYFDSKCAKKSYSNYFYDIAKHYLGESNILGKDSQEIIQMFNFIGTNIDMESDLYILHGLYLKKNSSYDCVYKKYIGTNLHNQLFSNIWLYDENFEEFNNFT